MRLLLSKKNTVTPNESMKAKTLSNLTIKSKYKRFEPINEQYTVYSIQYIVNSMYPNIGRQLEELEGRRKVQVHYMWKNISKIKKKKEVFEKFSIEFCTFCLLVELYPGGSATNWANRIVYQCI